MAWRPDDAMLCHGRKIVSSRNEDESLALLASLQDQSVIARSTFLAMLARSDLEIKTPLHHAAAKLHSIMNIFRPAPDVASDLAETFAKFCRIERPWHSQWFPRSEPALNWGVRYNFPGSMMWDPPNRGSEIDSSVIYEIYMQSLVGGGEHQNNP